MTDEQYEEIVTNLVVQGGNARSLAMEAIQAAKAGKFDEADNLIAECEKAMNAAHESQIDMIHQEIEGNSMPVKLLMVHAQDHVMDAIVVQDLAREIIDLYKIIKK